MGQVLLVLGSAAVLLIALGLAWRWASRQWQLPCPSLFAGALASGFYYRILRTEETVDALGLRPGMRVLEVGPGPGRLLLPAARRVLPGGEAVGLDIQSGMVARLEARARAAGLPNVRAVLGDATQEHFDEASFDVVLLCTVLGEIPDRQAALRQIHRVLAPGGLLSITEIFGDPHFQSQATLQRIVPPLGFRLREILGPPWFYTANFVKA